MGALGDIGHAIMTPLYYAVSAIMLAWHWVFSQIGLDPDSGWTWALSIIGLTVTIRALLIPLFVKQIKSSRNMQLLQPKIRELQKKYGHDRERMAQEQMKLFKDAGTNPFASCLPILLQMPVFFALFRLIDHAAVRQRPEGLLDKADAISIAQGELFNGVLIGDRFTGGGSVMSIGETSLSVQVTTIFLVVLMCATTFLTQRQLMSKNMPKDAMSGPYAQQQKLLLYVLPFVFAIGGVAFPIGVLLYWTTTNFWTMGQQFYVIRNNPAPGTPAFKAKQDRDAKHGKQVTEDPVEAAKRQAEEEAAAKKAAELRQQPKKQTRNQRKKSGGRPGGGPAKAGSNGQQSSRNPQQRSKKK